ncbi:CPBP family intramembrane glutamic endopeptidase [Jeotgalibacillus proteolyticus]|uniref:CPBP family intramembrane metalloprotease n=1 Tax=Jeotgalibacillus proteolyticus TaxID=2082395 RepID=A0A2S5GEB6_9BACL|nr:type II CAAX endopeptidase family protein [Jeotgalibacillus proteolyticus]PPA71288.1 CPBP family intramembrane metalloprotease [Jeotgalibacillus proteolyticus]
MRNQEEAIRQMTGYQLYRYAILTQIFLLLASIIGGIFAFNAISQFFDLFNFNLTYIVAGIMLGILIAAADLALMNHLKESYYDDGGVNEKIFSSLTPVKIVWFSLIVAISEELFFRGIIQTNTNLWVASLLFAAVHVRYLRHWYLALNILILSFIIGGVYEWTASLWTVISLHFTVNTMLGLYVYRKSKHNI